MDVNIPIETFRTALLAAYRERPCQVLPNALWKTLAEIPNYTCDFTADGACVMQLRMVHDDALMLYWDRSRRLPQFSESFWENLRFALLHADFADDLSSTRLRERLERAKAAAHFRLRHNLESVPDVALPSGYSFVDARVEREASAIAGFIAACYDSITLTAGAVRAWPRLPVYEPHLVFWIVDTAHNRPAALAVSDFDAQVPEVSLEWIQVHPDYRRRGLGTALVQETLTRARGRAAFATVSGKVHNPTNPEGLYRRCGFYGDDVWYVLHR